MSAQGTATRATQNALALLSADCPSLAAVELRKALEALQNPTWPQEEGAQDAETGIIWWNRLSRRERAYWLDVAGSARPADAWKAFQAGAPSLG